MRGDLLTVVVIPGIAVPILQIAALGLEETRVATCNDVPFPVNSAQVCKKVTHLRYSVGGYDPEPADMAVAPGNLVARKVANQLPTLSNMDGQHHIWPVLPRMGDNWAMDIGNTFYYYQKTGIKSIPFYVTAFPPNFNTGVLREHAMRLNTSVSCKTVPRSSFPDICPGDRPLAGEFNNSETRNRYCVAGDYTTVPWTIDRNRQDMIEELWVDNYIPYGSPISLLSSFVESAVNNITVHCMANTTRGYFELPNFYNEGTPGTLLEEWPSQDVLEQDFNDVEAFSDKPPAESNPRNTSDVLIFRYGPDPFDSWSQKTPGPLTVLMNAMLGNESWFYPIVNATLSNEQEIRDAFVSSCLRGLPFSTYTGIGRNGFASANVQCSFLNMPGKVPEIDDRSHIPANNNETTEEITGDLSRMVAEWFSGFAFNASTEDALSAGMYLANEAILTLTADASRLDSARPIYVSNGTALVKPSIHNTAKVIMSFLVLVEIAGLLLLAVFIYRMPTFASRLDTVHIAAIGAQLVKLMGEELPPLGLYPRGRARERYMKGLQDVDGLIGVQEEVELTSFSALRNAGFASASASINAATPRTSTTLTNGAGAGYGQGPQYHLFPQTQSPRPPSHPGTGTVPTPVASGPQVGQMASNTSLPFVPRPPPRTNSFGSTSATHNDEDIITPLVAVSEVNDPDGPPKYGDVIQADAEAAEAAEAAAARKKVLVVGGSGNITRQMAKKPGIPARGTTQTARPRGPAIGRPGIPTSGTSSTNSHRWRDRDRSQTTFGTSSQNSRVSGRSSRFA
ncbi:hypothetical protein VM1G_02340 [Cytospora mali]|uniref:Uncharacterized protein n=1 Tax=Cytospora mali TaxID=578113 RepID=A0A194VRP1_CYTMA|nr:hypothetical protein VM1G_02340 [Valsa mali]